MVRSLTFKVFFFHAVSKYSVVVNQKGSDKLRIRGIQARIDDEGYGGGDGYSSGTSVRSSGSSVYTSASSDSGSGKKKPKIADDITIAFSSKDGKCSST